MNCSWKISKQGKLIIMTWVIIAVFFFTAGIVIGSICFRSEPVSAEASTPTEVTMPVVTPEPTAEPTPTYTSLGEYRLTAYCSCEKCCGIWAENRPLDENGKPIVYTANQSIAKQGVTVAADTDVLPFGTVLLIGGHEYIVQDRGGAIKGNRIDIYFESHEEALEFGVQYDEVFKKGE